MNSFPSDSENHLEQICFQNLKESLHLTSNPQQTADISPDASPTIHLTPNPQPTFLLEPTFLSHGSRIYIMKLSDPSSHVSRFHSNTEFHVELM